MQVKILRTTVADGKIVRAGSICDLSQRDAELLLTLGKATKAFDPAPVADEPQIAKRRGRPPKAADGQ